jgi:hypothetical protein
MAGHLRADAVFAALPNMLAMLNALGWQPSKGDRPILRDSPPFPSAPFPRAALLTNLPVPCLCLQLSLTLSFMAVPFLPAN